jgi:hypothetical protein
MKHIINDVNVSAKEGNFCIFSIMEFIMEHYKFNVSNIDLFFLCNGMNFIYKSDLNFIGYDSFENLLLNLVESNFFKLTAVFKNNSNDYFFEESFKEICRDNLVLLLVGTKGLTYHRVFIENETNRGHSIILYGFDTKEDIAYIGDSYIKDVNGQLLSFQGCTPLHEVKEVTFGLAWFDMKTSIKVTKNDVLLITIKNMEKFLAGKTDGNTYYGNTAIMKFVSDFDKLHGIADDLFAGTCMNIYYNIKIRSINVLLEYMIELIEKNIEFQINGYDALLTSIREVISNWSMIAINVLRTSRSNKRGNIPDIIEFSNKNIVLQNIAFSEFLKYLKRLVV